MPIQIKELIIRATVDEGSGSAQASGDTPAPAASKKGQDREAIVKLCVDQVLEILRLQNER